MKKILMATILAASSSIALAQLSMSGKLAETMNVTRTPAGSVAGLQTDPSSNLTFKVSEDLGMGLKVKAVIETSIAGNTLGGAGTQIGDRETTLSLSNNFGSVGFGRATHHSFNTLAKHDVFANFYGSVAGDVHNLRGERFGEAMFVAVTPIKGISVNYERSKPVAGVDATTFGASGNLGIFDLSVSRFQSGTEQSNILGASVKLANTKVTFSHSANNGLVSSTGNLIGVAHPFGNIVAKASYGRASNNTTAYNLGVDYNFSKRTVAYAAYKKVSIAGVDNSQYGVGLSHSF